MDSCLDVQRCQRKIRLRCASEAVWDRKFRVNERTERRYADLCSLVEPYMSVYAGSFVEPAFLQCRVDAYAYEVLASVVEVLRDVIDLGGIAAWLMSEVETVHPYAGVAEYAVELQPQVLSIVLSRHCEGLSVPADAGVWILISDCLVSMAMAGFRSVWKVHYPVVRQIYDCPSRSVELRGVWAFVVD